MIQICVAMRGRLKNNKNKQQLEPRFDWITNTLTSVQKDNLILEKWTDAEICGNTKISEDRVCKKIRKQYESGKIIERRCNMREYTIRKDGLTNTLTTVQKDNYIVVIE